MLKTSSAEQSFWHDNPWWREPAYDGWGIYAPEYRETILSSLGKIFDRKWYNNGDIRHPALLFLHGKGVWPYDYLLDLADACHLASSHKLLNKALIENLRLPDHFFAAYFEVSVLAQLIRGGIVPQRPPRTGKNADFLIPGKPDVYLEVKHAKVARENADARSLEIAVMNLLNEAIPVEVSFHAEFGAEIRELLATRDGIKTVRTKWPVWRDQLRHELKAAIAEKAWLEKRGISGICTFTLSEATGGSRSGEFTGASIMPNFELAKLCENVIRKAAQQIPKDAVGIIVIRTEHLVPSLAQTIEDYLAAEAIKNISSVVLVERTYGMMVKTRSEAIYNTAANADLRDSKIIEQLTKWTI